MKQTIIDTSKYSHNPIVEELASAICTKSSNSDKNYFRVIVAFYLATIASNMRATLVTADKGEIPVNVYTLALASSGFGKGLSATFMEDLLEGFKDRFINETLPYCAEKNLFKRAKSRATRNRTDENDEFDGLKKYYEEQGEFPYAFAEGNSPAVKQMRQKLLLADAGAITLIIDEIGRNLIGQSEILTLGLELFDQGKTRQKLTKNTKDNVRGEDISGKTPTNMLLFGAPEALLNGSEAEKAFYDFLETGYARRFLFGIGTAPEVKIYDKYTPEEMYKLLVKAAKQTSQTNWRAKFYTLADPGLVNWKITVPEEVGIASQAYHMECMRIADKLPAEEVIRRAEITHRYFKTLKLAGVYAFLDKASEMTLDHFHQAQKLVEESGQNFGKILTRDKPYARIAKYIADTGTEVTHADLNEKFSFYKTGYASRKEMMDMARAWGIKNNVLIKTNVNDGIEFFSADTLQTTDLDKLILSGSGDLAFQYKAMTATWDEVCGLGAEGIPTENPNELLPVHWINHYVRDEHRCEDCIIDGFNLIVLDVDGTLPIKTFQEMFKDYKYALYTTKRSTPECERYRVIFPTNFTLELNREDYKDFMNNILSWMPFNVDPAVNQRAHKWLTNPNTTLYKNDGKLFDVLPFIPHTKRNETFMEAEKKIGNFGALEKWFSRQYSEGNRNNVLYRYAMALLDAGKSSMEIERCVLSFNDAQENKLNKDEIKNTILTQIARKQIAA